MSMNFFNVRQDVSYLFSGLNRNSTGSGNAFSWLSDYASIKNGSYGKLMRAYYNESSSEKVSSFTKNSVNKTQTEQKAQKEELSKVTSSADALKESADALLKKGKDSVFEKEEENAVYDAVSSFVKNYNETLKAASDTSNKSVTNRVNNLMNNTNIYAKQLAKIGITIGEDKSLSIDKDTFMKADKNDIMKLFQGNGSFGYQTSAQASLISYAAENALSSTGLYSSSGNNYYSTGNLFNNYF